MSLSRHAVQPIRFRQKFIAGSESHQSQRGIKMPHSLAVLVFHMDRLPSMK